MQKYNDEVKVYHKETGATRMMGSAQFNLFGKNKGWVLAPDAELPKTENTDTSGDESGTDEGTDATGAIDYNKLNAKDLVAKIKELGEAGDLDVISKIHEDERVHRQDSRSTVITACEKYLDTKDEEE